MTDINRNSYVRDTLFTGLDSQFKQEKTGFENAANLNNVNFTGEKKIALVFILPAWVMYTIGVSCVVGGAYALDNIRKILFGEPRISGSPAQEGLINDIINSIREDRRFCTLPADMKNRVKKIIKNWNVLHTEKNEPVETESKISTQLNIATSGGAMPPDDEENRLREKIKKLEQELKDLQAQIKTQNTVQNIKPSKQLTRQVESLRTAIANANKNLNVYLGKLGHNQRTQQAKQKMINTLQNEMKDPQSVLNRAKGWF